MPTAPKNNEERLNKILNAWKNLAADKTFGGMTVAQFETEIQPSFAVRGEITDLQNRTTMALNKRTDVDEHSLGKADMVVAGVVGDPNFGPDSSLYEAMGYTRKSERKSGLTRKGGSSPPVAPKT
jgi:hypothetical protein